jgi:CRP-like cAMP-binding protein
MARDWLKQPKKRRPTLGELIAAKEYPEAIEVLRAQLKRRPGPQTRLQLADLLLLAGRRDDAMPILIGLADELSADGFVAKAVAILKRIDRLEPGRPDIEVRLGQLARQPLRTLPDAVTPPPAPAVVFGMEDISHEPAIDRPAAAVMPEAEARVEGSPAETAMVETAPDSTSTVLPESTGESPAAAEEASAAAAAPPLEAPAEAAETTRAEGAREGGLSAIWRRLWKGARADSEPDAEPQEAPEPEGTHVPEAEPPSEPGSESPTDAEPPASGEATGTAEALLPPIEGPGDGPEQTENASLPEAAAPAVGAEATEGPIAETAGPISEASSALVPDAEPTADAEPAPIASAEPSVLGIEADAVVDPQPAAVAVEPIVESVVEPVAEAVVEPESVVEPVVEPVIDAIVEPEGEPQSPPEPEPVAESSASPGESPAADAPSGAVAEKLGGVFKRFLAALPEGEEDEHQIAARDFAAALAAAGIDSGEDEDDDEVFQAFIDDDEAEILSQPQIAADVRVPEPAAKTPSKWAPPMSEDGFRDQVLDLIEEVLKRPPEPEPVGPIGETTEPIASAYRDELLAHPLFRELSGDAMLAMLRALRFVCFEPGEVIVAEGEPGGSLFLLVSGAVKLFVRNPSGHNVPVGRLSEGAFFGEMSLLSGRPRNATVTAAGRVDLLELPKPLLDGIAQIHPRVRDTVDALYLERASSAEVSAVRNIATGDAETRERATQILKAYFGGRRWEPRMQLKLAMVLIKAGKEDEAVPVLVDLADTLLREGTPAKAMAILKKVEMIRTRSLQVVNLAPLMRVSEAPLPDADPAPAPAAAAPAPPSWLGRTEGFFQDWLGTFRRSVAGAGEPASRRIPGYAPGLVASPLFEGCSEEELLAFMQGLRLTVFEPGDVILTEGERGESVFILTTGTVKVYVRNPVGQDVELCELREGAFFGEMSTLSGRPRTATVTAATRCELLELDRETLDRISASHPRVRQVLEEVYIERASSSQAARIRTAAESAPDA